MIYEQLLQYVIINSLSLMHYCFLLFFSAHSKLDIAIKNESFSEDRLNSTFNTFDTGHKGALNADELKLLLQYLGGNGVDQFDLNFSETELAMSTLDPLGNGFVRFESICAWYLSS